MALDTAAVSLGVAVSSKAKSVLQAAFAGVFIALPMSLLGVCISNIYRSANVLTLQKFVPTYWIIDGVNKLLDEQGLSAIGGNLLMVLLFTAVLFLFGTWRREDIAE